ncbi:MULTISPECIES: MFS transporter [unclassified Streptomyces]|uniref:MFS transporter n=1 Tax=unclassified Streptomyces TaxID=2593676 RepID=UPI002250EA48|nr:MULTISPECIES: MFS transporter [unclassified Streptomyces]MCX5437022.1 MHS family MFS transporter [Streptomyces sp. NBC_00063]WSE14748.1 MHS family MFS transporter [Streptomyces sp. NBC_01397]WUB96337.1 MHS family MFS transporter [Streptomyces sp. NBC_00569]
MQHDAPVPGVSATQARDARRAGVTAFVGTTIEWFDFYIYGSASALVLGKIFFAEASPAVGTLAAFATFWVGFLARPLGGLIFGHFGDRYGRKKALVTTLTMMGAATFCVGLLPGYAQIGVAAPVLLVLLRMIQGVAMGGEWGGAVLIATEYAPPKRKLLYGAFAQQGSPVGNLLATLAFLGIAQLPDAAFESWGWRVPFLFSAVLVAVGLFIRLRLAETPEMAAALERKQTSKLPIKDVLTRSPMLVLLGVLAGTAGVAITYVKTTFALSWATSDLGFDRTSFLTVISLALVVQVVVQPFGAVLASKWPVRKAVLWMLLPEFVVLPLMFVLVGTGNFWLAVLGMGLATFPHAMYYAALAGILARVFPVEVRYTGMSLSYQLCTTLFAGTAPIVSQYLLNATGSIWPVVALGLGYTLVTLVGVLPLLARTAAAQEPAAVTTRTASHA